MHRALRAVESPRTAPSTRLKSAFTMVELLAAIAIIALLIAVMVPAIGNYVETARKTADRQTLMVLNDALTRYKTMGGDLNALTVGASIGNVLTSMQTPVTWAGNLNHQFLKTGTTYDSSDLSVSGNRQTYKFTRYRTYIDGTSYANDVTNNYTVSDPDAFESWMADAMLETESTNYAVFTNPDTTQLFGIYARIATNDDKVRVWWGDGTTEDFDDLNAGSNTIIAKDFGSAAARTIVIVGDLSYILSNNEAELGGIGATYFGGNISNMQSLTYFNCYGSNTVSASLTELPRGMTYFSCGGNSAINGNLAELPQGLTLFACGGNNTIGGNLTDLPYGLSYFSCAGSNTITGNLEDLPTALSYFSCIGSNTVGGNVANLPSTLLSFYCIGANTVSGNLANLPNGLYYFVCLGYNTVTYNTSSGGHSWAGGMRRIYIRPGNSELFTSSVTDALLVDLSAVSTWTNEKEINLQGNCGARTSTSDAAVATLQANGVSVYTN